MNNRYTAGMILTTFFLSLFSNFDNWVEGAPELYFDENLNAHSDLEAHDELGNGAYEEYMVSIDAEHVSDLFGLYLSFFDFQGEEYQIWFDTTGGDYFDSGRGIQVPVYNLDDTSALPALLSLAINDLQYFDSWLVENGVYIRSKVKGDLLDPSMSQEAVEIQVHVLKQGSMARINPYSEEVFHLLKTGWNHHPPFVVSLDDGGFIMAGNVKADSVYVDGTWKLYRQNQSIGCEIGSNSDNRSSFIMKIDEMGNCDWVRRISGWNYEGGIGGIHSANDGIIVYMVSKTEFSGSAYYPDVVPTYVLGNEYWNTDLFGLIGLDGNWLGVKQCPYGPLGPSMTSSVVMYGCDQYSVSGNSVFVHDTRGCPNNLPGVLELEMNNTNPLGTTSCFGSPHELLVKVLQDGTKISVRSNSDLRTYSGIDVTSPGISECLNPTIFEDGWTSRNWNWNGNDNSFYQSYFTRDSELVFAYMYPDVDMETGCFLKISVSGQTIDSRSLPGYRGDWSTLVPRDGANEVCLTNAGYSRPIGGPDTTIPSGGYMYAGGFFGVPDGVEAPKFFDFSISCFDTNFNLIWDYSTSISKEDTHKISWDFSGSDLVIISEGVDGNYSVTKITPPDRVDQDSDSILDVSDYCLNTAIGDSVDSRGCSWSQNDDDSDSWSNGDELQCGTELLDATSIPEDNDADHVCDSMDDDDDNDGVADEIDIFPLDGSEWGDYDKDGIGDNVDLDDDDDGWSDSEELRCNADYLDPNSIPIDENRDGECDNPLPSISPDLLEFCEFPDLKIYSDSEGCSIVYGHQERSERSGSNIVSISELPLVNEEISKMALSPDGDVLAILDVNRNLRVEFLKNSDLSYSYITTEDERLINHPTTGRISIATENSCVDIITNSGCQLDWSNGFDTSTAGVYWSGPVYFSHDFVACKPGWSGLAHCSPGWYEIGEWNEFSSPSMMGLVSRLGSSEYCSGCSSPDGRFLADVTNIVTDWELLGYADVRMDVTISETETWVSEFRGYQKPGGIATVAGGHLIDECNSVVCLLSEIAEKDDNMMFGFGGFAWSSDSNFLYAATSDSIITIDPVDRTSKVDSNPYSCSNAAEVSSIVGISSLDGTTVIIPCGDRLIVLEIERGSDGIFVLVLLISVIFILGGGLLIKMRSKDIGKIKVTFTLALLILSASMTGCIADDLDTDNTRLPDSIDISSQGGYREDGKYIFLEFDASVPPETIDVLVISETSHMWMDLLSTSQNIDQVCPSICDLEVVSFYMGEQMSYEKISFT